MKTKSLSSGVHRFQVTTPLIDEPIEERKVVLCQVALCQVETDDTSRRIRSHRPRPGMWQVRKTLFRDTPPPQENIARIPTAPSLGFDLDPDVFKEPLMKDQGG